MLSRSAAQATRRGAFEIGACLLLTLFMAGGMTLFWYKQKRDSEKQLPAKAASDDVATTYTPGPSGGNLKPPTFDDSPVSSAVSDSDTDRNEPTSSSVPPAAKPASLSPGSSRPVASLASSSSGSGRSDPKTLFASSMPPPPIVKKPVSPTSTSQLPSPASFGFKAPTDPTKPKGGCGCGKKK
jgi:hypothetical protein